jgi:NTE family protein
LNIPLSADAAGYYSTQPLAETLSELIDFSEINAGRTRVSIGAANLHSSEMRYFDSRDVQLSVKHIMASGALPPAFPPVRIDDELYWDGGILSNTPVEAVFDDKPRRNSLLFVVHLWNPQGPEPGTMRQVMHRHKELQYSSRSMSHIQRQRQIHRLRHIVAELAALLPESQRAAREVGELASYGCMTRMHVVRLLAPMIEGEDHTKDIDFSASGIRRRREAGHAHGRRVLETEPWRGEFDPHEGFILHEVPSTDATM